MTTGPDGALLVVGDVVTDVVARHRGPLAAGTDTAASIRRLPGGAGANVACWAAYEGCRDVRLLGRVGADAADWHERELTDRGVRTLLIVDASAPTGTVISLVDTGDSAERTFLTDSGASLRIGRDDWSDGLLDGVARLHLSGYLLFSEPSRALVPVALAAARARGIPVSLDPASAGFLAGLGADRFLALVGEVDVLLPSRDEACLLTGLPDPADAAAKLSRHVPTVVVKQGAEGAVVARSGAVSARVPALRASPLDSTGAGDAFTGAFLAALLRGAEPEEAAAAGCGAGATAVGRVGGRPPREPGRREPGRRPDGDRPNRRSPHGRNPADRNPHGRNLTDGSPDGRNTNHTGPDGGNPHNGGPDRGGPADGSPAGGNPDGGAR